MRKYLYLIKKQKIKSWLKFWLLTKEQVKYILSEILEGFSFDLQNTVKKRFKIFNIFGNSVQDGTPSPENPVPIDSVADDVNLINVEDGTATATKQFDITNNVEPGQNYSASALLDLTNSPSGTQSRIRIDQYVNGAWIYNSSLNIINSGNSGKSIVENFTINENATQVRLTVQNYVGGNLNCDYSQIKLQKGTVATPYSPYNYGTFTIDFEGQTENYNYTFITKPLRSLPNGVRDSLEADGIHRRVGRVVLDGTQPLEIVNWRPTETSVGWVYPISITNNKKQTEGVINNILCNKLKAVSYEYLFGNTVDEGINIVTQSNYYGLVVKTKDTSLTTANAINTYLSSNPITVQYELETEIIEPYTEEQQEQYNKIKELYTFDGTTNISSDDEVPPYLQIQYYMKGE